MTPAFRYVLLWIVASLTIVVAALTMLGGSFLNGQYVPANPDAFYHARRILDTVITGTPVQQFDALIHVPEGSWIAWPWGFDTVLASLVGMFGPFASEADAARVLMHVPVGLAPIVVALVLVLSRQLQLSLASAAFVVFGFVGLPLVFLAFAVGNVDHHFAEMLWALLSLCAGIWCMRSPASTGPALAAALVLGTAVAVHNSLFILQLPLLMVFVLRWLRGHGLPARRAVFTFGAVLIGTTVLVSMPSEPWRRGAFEFYSLSWFHTYVAVVTALLLAALVSVRATAASISSVAVATAAATVPLLASFRLGGQFVSGELDHLRDVTEVLSPYQLYSLFGPAQSTQLFSWLMWLALPAVAMNLYWATRVAEPGRQFFAVAAAFFLALTQLQYRFGVIGIAPLLLTLALAFEAAAIRWRLGAVTRTVAPAVVLILALLPTRNVWTTPRSVGGDPLYVDLHPGLLHLREACLRRPGVALAAINDGHWVRYHTQCSVIGNVFLLTDQHARKRLEVEALLALSPEELSKRGDIAYVFAHSELELFVPVAADGSVGQGKIRWKTDALPRLTRALLAPPDQLPSGYRVLWTSVTPEGEAFARLLEVER